MMGHLSRISVTRRLYSGALRILVTCTLALSLSNCSTTSQLPQQPVQWQQHLQAISALQAWQLDAKIALRAPKNNKSANIHWQQTQDNFLILLSGPFGQGAVSIKGNGQSATLEQSGVAPITAESAEALLWQTTRWQIPFTPLSSWVRGIPDAHLTVDKLQLNELGLLAELQQAGWNISYSRYQLINQTYLPGKIVATSGDIKLILAIHHWQHND